MKITKILMKIQDLGKMLSEISQKSLSLYMYKRLIKTTIYTLIILCLLSYGLKSHSKTCGLCHYPISKNEKCYIQLGNSYYHIWCFYNNLNSNKHLRFNEKMEGEL